MTKIRNSLSLDEFYIRHEKGLKLAEIFTEHKNLAKILKACRLKPYSVISDTKEKRQTLNRVWIDDWGNTLKFDLKKQISIILNDLKNNRNKIIATDLYSNIGLLKTIKFADKIYLCLGKNEENKVEITISCLGIDEYLRSFYFDEEWISIPPIMLGISNLSNIFEQTENYKKFENKENLPIPCLEPESYLISLPANQEIISLIRQKYKINLTSLGDSNNG
jgi:hypothetical protein